MKKGLIVALVLLNVVLLAAVVGYNMPRAQGQVIGGTDYLMVSGRFGTNQEAIYLIDLAKRKMATVLVDTASRKVTVAGVRSLLRDFNRK